MNYNISFLEMNRLAKQANSKKTNVSLDQMRKQASQLKNSSGPKVKKQQFS
jgi:replication initiation and membrane attachment protein DnaB